MPLNAKQIEDILPGFMEYEPEDIEIEDLHILDSNRVKASITIQGSPRDEGELFVSGDSSLDISFVTGNSTSDNAPTDTVFRTGIVIEKQDMHENPHLEDLPHDMITIMLSGNLSAPEYCDDESDGYLSGIIYIEAGSSGWAEEESRKDCIRDIESAVEDMVRTTSSQVRTLRALGHREPVARDSITDLVRHCLKAA